MTTRTRDRRRVERAFRELLSALGAPRSASLEKTPQRAAALWLEHLTAGEGKDLGAVLGRGSRDDSRTPVVLTGIGVHLVCPHHLTVAFGECHVGYVPNGRIVGFGALTRLVEACSARLVLQENVSRIIVDALLLHLGASAAAVCIEAVHPCHNVMHARSHRARATTWASGGAPSEKRRLERALRLAMERGDRPVR